MSTSSDRGSPFTVKPTAGKKFSGCGAVKSTGCSRAIAGAAWATTAVAPTIIRSRRVTLKESELLTGEPLGLLELRESINGAGFIRRARQANPGYAQLIQAALHVSARWLRRPEKLLTPPGRKLDRLAIRSAQLAAIA
jgi:hypothetical protein